MAVKSRRLRENMVPDAAVKDQNTAMIVTVVIILLFVALVSIPALSTSSLDNYQPASLAYEFQRNDTPIQTSVTIVYSKGS